MRRDWGVTKRWPGLLIQPNRRVDAWQGMMGKKQGKKKENDGGERLVDHAMARGLTN